MYVYHIFLTYAEMMLGADWLQVHDLLDETRSRESVFLTAVTKMGESPTTDDEVQHRKNNTLYRSCRCHSLDDAMPVFLSNCGSRSRLASTNGS